ncbi:MAG: hypothetical protein IPN04_06995 [Rhodoferax sp.]|nr:hypothetical protein [Rhodoferax sp.]
MARLIVIALATAIVVQNRQHIWNDKISSLSPVSQTDIQLDASLRMDTGAPDTRYILVNTVISREDVPKTVNVSVSCKHTRTRFAVQTMTPSRYLPSLASQKQRHASLPDVETLKRILTAASVGLPFKTDVFALFTTPLKKPKAQPLLKASDLANSSMQTALDALATTTRLYVGVRFCSPPTLIAALTPGDWIQIASSEHKHRIPKPYWSI